jgi:hypothetical protein
MANKTFHIVINNVEALILPFPELLLALGRTTIDLRQCVNCGETILFGDRCCHCPPNAQDQAAGDKS